MTSSGWRVILQEAVRARELATTSGNKELIESTTRLTKLFDDYQNYVDKMASPSSPVLEKIVQFTHQNDWKQFKEEGKSVSDRPLNPRMMTGHEEAQVLRMLVSMCKSKHVLEIGMFTGCAALAMAEVLPDDGSVVTCDVNPGLEDIVRGFVSKSPHGKKITIKIGPALETLKALKDERRQFDFVFLDADKPNNINYYGFCLDEGILAPGGTICVDNVLFSGNVFLPPEERDSSRKTPSDAMVDFNDRIAQDDRVYRVLLPVRDGMLLIRRKDDVDIDKVSV